MNAVNRRAYNALKKIGAPVFIREDKPETFGLTNEGYYPSSEVPIEKRDENRRWCDYYEMSTLNTDGMMPGVDAEVESILRKYGLYLEWENPACLFAYEM